MQKWKITAEFTPLTQPSEFKGNPVHKKGDPMPYNYTVHAGDLIEGIEVDGWIKTHIDGVAEEVYIEILGHAKPDAPLSPEPIRSDDHAAFCALVTDMARKYEADRNYLVAWAFLGTNNFQELGQPGDGKIGPFQFSTAEWEAAIKGPAKGLSLSAEQRGSWRDQIPVAALVWKDCIQRLQSAKSELPTRLEVYFAQKFGPGAEEVLKQPRSDRCRDWIKNAPPAGTYATELANSDKTIQQALDDLRAPLESGFRAAYTLIDTQPPEIRFFSESDLPPAAGDAAPWLKVAKDEMTKGVTRDSGNKNTAEIQKYFEGTGTHPGDDTPWCGAFVAYCMKNCGVAEVASSMGSVPNPARAVEWMKWGKPATGKPPIGCVVVLKPQEKGTSGHVGFLYEPSDGKTIKLLAGNQAKHGEHNHVGVVEFPVDGEKGVNGFRWLEVAHVPAATTAGSISVARINVEEVEYTRYAGGGDIDSWIDQACQAAGLPLTDAWRRGFRTLCERESTKDPNAVNTKDRNAHGPTVQDGHPRNCSRGIAQCVPETFAGNHVAGTSLSIYDPVANIAAAMQYVRRRYHVSSNGSDLAKNVQQADPARSRKGY